MTPPRPRCAPADQDTRVPRLRPEPGSSGRGQALQGMGAMFDATSGRMTLSLTGDRESSGSPPAATSSACCPRRRELTLMACDGDDRRLLSA